MEFTDNEIATYLFCARLNQTRTNPLTILEWNTVIKSFSEVNMQPKDLLSITENELADTLTLATPAQKVRIINKVKARQKLGISVLELKELKHQGYGIIFRSQMPARLKKLTQKYTPAFFHYAGDLSILTHRALGVVGARDASEEELSQTAVIGKEAASQGVVIISGGARGVDSTAVESTLENGGKAIVFPAEGLAKWIVKSSIRNYITNGQLLLMSTQQINAPFTGAYAMQRNKFIHAPSDAVLVASSKISGNRKSGTWEGVLENLDAKWSPIYVIGNSEGIEKLKAEGNAKQFSTFSEIGLKNNLTMLDEEIQTVVQRAIAEGLDREMIERNFLDILDDFYKRKEKNERNKKETKQLVVYEQLTLEDYLG